MKHLLAASLAILIALGSAEASSPFYNDANIMDHSLTLAGVIVHGNRTITDDEIIRLLDYRIGQDFNEQDLAKGQKRLEVSGLFRSVEISTRRGREEGQIVVVVDVREKRLPYVDWFEPRVVHEGYVFNLIQLATHTPDHRGTFEAEGRLLGEWSGVRASGGYRPSLLSSAKLYAEGRGEWTNWILYPYESRPGYQINLGRFGGQVGFRTQLGKLGTLKFGPGATAYYVGTSPKKFTSEDLLDETTTPPSREIPTAIRSEKSTVWATGNMSLESDTRDDQLYPHSGHWVQIPAEYGYDPSNDRNYLRLDLDARAYLPIGRGSTFAFRGRAGHVFGDAPYYRRLTLSRGFPMRGFAYGSIDPPYGATSLFQGSIEYRTPVLTDSPKPFLMLSLFADAGAAWNHDGRVSVDDPDYSLPSLAVGWGLTFKVPVLGPLSLNMAYPVLSNAPKDRIHATISFGFAF